VAGSNVTFGIRSEQLIFARFDWTDGNGLTSHVDETSAADILVTDTTVLPALVVQHFGNRTLLVTGFSLGMGSDGQAHIDWSSAVDQESGKIIEELRWKPEDEFMLGWEDCRLVEHAICGYLCTGVCVDFGGDPCWCPETGFCFVDYYIWDCHVIDCPHSCIAPTPYSCLCVAGVASDIGGASCKEDS
jgi:hypothetical protein